MELQKLSYNVNKKATVSIKRVVIGFCILVGLTVLGLILSYTIRDNEKQVRLYSAQIDNSMSQKVAFINTIAAGASSGVAESDYYAYVNSMVDQYDDVSAVYVCVLEEGLLGCSGVVGCSTSSGMAGWLGVSSPLIFWVRRYTTTQPCARFIGFLPPKLPSLWPFKTPIA